MAQTPVQTWADHPRDDSRLFPGDDDNFGTWLDGMHAGPAEDDHGAGFLLTVGHWTALPGTDLEVLVVRERAVGAVPEDGPEVVPVQYRRRRDLL